MSRKKKYTEYYWIPFPDSQRLEDVDFGEGEFYLDSEGCFVEKQWFDSNRKHYGL